MAEPGIPGDSPEKDAPKEEPKQEPIKEEVFNAEAERKKIRAELEAEFQEHKAKLQKSLARQALKAQLTGDEEEIPAHLKQLVALGKMTATHWEMEETLETLGGGLSIDDPRLVKDKGMETFKLSVAQAKLEDADKKVKEAEAIMKKYDANIEKRIAETLRDERAKLGLDKVETGVSQGTAPAPQDELAKAVEAAKAGKITSAELRRIRQKVGG